MTTKQHLVNLPNGMTCSKDYEKEALKVYQDAFDRTFDGNNYEHADARADLALYNYLRD